MKYRIDFLDKAQDKDLLDKFEQEVNLGYPLDRDCEFIVARNGSTRIMGLIGFNIIRRYPQFQHIILMQNTPRLLFVKLYARMENYLRDRGYKEYVAYVENIHNDIQLYAQRIGMTAYDKDNEGVWFYKTFPNKER